MKRLQSFNLLAACYETSLMDPDSRRRYDTICRELEQSKLQAGVRGALFVGGKPLQSPSLDDQSLASERKILNGVFSLIRKGTSRSEKDPNSIPPLSRASSESSTEPEEVDAPLLSSDLEESWCAFSQEPSSFTTPSRKISRVVTAATVTTKPSVVDQSPGLKGGACNDVCSFVDSIVQQLDFTREEFLEEWRRMLSYDMSFNLAGMQ